MLLSPSSLISQVLTGLPHLSSPVFDAKTRRPLTFCGRDGFRLKSSHARAAGRRKSSPQRWRTASRWQTNCLRPPGWCGSNMVRERHETQVAPSSPCGMAILKSCVSGGFGLLGFWSLVSGTSVDSADGGVWISLKPLWRGACACNKNLGHQKSTWCLRHWMR